MADDAAELSIAGRAVGALHPPYVVAEMSGNHNGSLDRALETVDAVADAGADALKLQTYTANTMTLELAEREFRIDDPNSLWFGRSLHELYEAAHTPWDWHAAIFERCQKRGLTSFSTPFDATAVAFLESLQVPCYKIASFENIDLPLIRLVAATGKPVIISTGLATLDEIEEAVTAVRQAGCRELALLKCTSAYPANPADSNLSAIPTLARKFGCVVGLSDHTEGVASAIAGVALGACIIEKHVTLRRSYGGVDSAFSLEPAELARLVKDARSAWLSIGSVRFGPSKAEQGSMQFRRSLYVVRDMRAGEALSPENLRAIRPGLGLPPKHYDALLGRRLIRDVPKGTPMRWELLEP